MTARQRVATAVIACVLTAVCVACDRPNAPSSAVTILQINDIYEIDAIEGGRAGGLSRTATVLRGLERTQPPVLMTLGGDYLSPAAIASAIVDGEPLAGRQMVDVLNHVGLDWAVFGNHEFDVPEVPGIDVVLGGHEHENRVARRGPHFTPIIKADANVRSVAIVTLTFGSANRRPSVSSRLEIIDQRTEAAPDV